MNSLIFEHNIECVMNYIKEHKNLPYEIIDIELRSIVEALFYQSLNDYRKTLKENQQLKKQKDDGVKFLKSIEMDKTDKYIPLRDYKEFGILMNILKGDSDDE